MTPEIRGISLVLLLSVIGVAADAVLKVASLKSSPFTSPWFLLGCVLGVLFAIVWVFLMQNMKIATAGLFYAVASALLLVLIGITFFNERLTPSELTGVSMAMVSLVLLGRVA